MTRALASLLILLAVVASGPTAAFGADKFSGTWKQNLEKSLYSPGPPAENSSSVRITALPKGLKSVQEGFNDRGQETASEFTAQFDGKDYPIKYTTDGKPDASPGADMVSVKKIDDSSVEFTYKLKGKVVQVNKVVISKDGKTRTTTQTGTNYLGQDFNNTIVYDKQ